MSTRDFSFVIVGGGILGSALANIAAAAGHDCLVLRRPDSESPHADTLRNQGWLQSGIICPIHQFKNEEAYGTFANQTFLAGRELLERCGLPVPQTGGILGLKEEPHLRDLTRKRKLLKLTAQEFDQLEQAEAERVMGSHYEPGSTYYRIPDGPFDEAAVLSHFRREAAQDGAVFIEVRDPVRLERHTDAVKISFEDREITSPTVVVTAGAGSISLMKQCGIALDGDLQRTPLIVGDAPPDMPAPIVIDLGRGFSAVRHERGGNGPAVVIGTRTKKRPAPDPAERIVSVADQQRLAFSIPPGFQGSLTGARYTAGYELMPRKGIGLSPYQPWMITDGPVIFASPGRATVSLLAARNVLADVIERRSVDPRRTSRVDLAQCSPWDCDIAMHYMPFYSFNDAEV
jgi:glycine/D-amino acid oxidase-like deaminating enzyme